MFALLCLSFVSALLTTTVSTPTRAPPLQNTTAYLQHYLQQIAASQPLSQPTSQTCHASLSMPILNWEDCAQAFIDLDQRPIASEPVLWGSPIDLGPGQLPYRVPFGQCMLELLAPPSLIPRFWVLDRWNAPAARLLLECVQGGPKRGGYALMGPEGHEIVVGFGVHVGDDVEEVVGETGVS